MSYFAIISDAACDLTREQQKRFGMDAWIGAAVVYPDGRSVEVDPDWKNITPEEYYGSMVDKKQMYKSSAVGPDVIKAVFREQLEKGNDVLYLSLSSGMSSLFNHATLAAKELKTEYPARKVVVMDSKRYSTAIALPCIYAAELRKQGKTLDETEAWLNENLDRIHQSGWMDDLFFLARAGRLSKGTAIMGTMIGVKPMADFNMDTGMFQVIGKARGVNRAMDAVVKYVAATIEKPEEQIVFVAHSYRKDYAEKLAARIREEIKPKELILNSVGQNCGANIGPGLVAAFYFGKPLSKDLTEEAATLQNILK
ncbi:MAG: DegV family protein [Clostridia bacterium]|nr:DegV family protein [Clostridia bacterium]